MSHDRFVDGYLGYLLGQANHALYKNFDSHVRAAGLSSIEWRVLATLHDSAPLTVSQLANEVLSKQPTVTKLVQRMADQGWVALLADPADQRTLVAWGRLVGASDRTLQRAFLAGTGLAFHEWRTRARVAAALRLLLTDRPVAAIAGDVGYATSSAFGAAFRRVTGLPPSAFRSR